jgi:hypothetical protein
MFISAPGTNHFTCVVRVFIKFGYPFYHPRFVAIRAKDMPARIGAEMILCSAVVTSIVILATPNISLVAADFAFSDFSIFSIHDCPFSGKRI